MPGTGPGVTSQRVLGRLLGSKASGAADLCLRPLGHCPRMNARPLWNEENVDLESVCHAPLKLGLQGEHCWSGRERPSEACDSALSTQPTYSGFIGGGTERTPQPNGAPCRTPPTPSQVRPLTPPHTSSHP